MCAGRVFHCMIFCGKMSTCGSLLGFYLDRLHEHVLHHLKHTMFIAFGSHILKKS